MNLKLKQNLLKTIRIFVYASFVIFLIVIYGIRLLTIHVVGEKINAVIIEKDVKGGGPNSRPFKLIYLRNNQIRELKIDNNIHLSNGVNDILDIYCAVYFGREWCFAYKKQVNPNMIFIFCRNTSYSVNCVRVFGNDEIVKTVYVNHLTNFGFETTKSGHIKVYFDSILVLDFNAEEELNNFIEIK